MGPVLDYEGVRSLLPQRYPFVFVDRVLRFDPPGHIECLKNVSANEPYFAGHFPEKAIMPGALMMEALAQSSILLFRLAHPEGFDTPRGDGAEGPGAVFVVGTSRSQFLQPVVPGDALHLHVEVEKLLSDSAIVAGRGEVDGRRVLSARLTFARIPAAVVRGALAPRDPADRMLGSQP